MSVPLTPHPLQHKLSLVFSILAILTGVRWYLKVVLIFMSLIAKEVEHVLKYLLAIWNSSVENSLFVQNPIFLIGLFRILMSSFLSSLYILEISPLSDVGLVKIFCFSRLPFLSYWLCPLLCRSSSVSGGPIYLLLFLLSVLLGLYLGSGLLCPCVAVYFPISLLSGSVWSDLYWGL